ncbi:isochorismatase family protein [Streptomyces albipurpureus]|uniref:Isochorismatase family protein n=1 Tax=Streptomyces albipurpureus TaxID=2897419 RepID=A0ABT0UET3_9ACTN|nr:isochorismatase family protein [Streptomyces sp. CWNU-1]MCM2386850.1 isochorismatase family protein [Streptomyces sp. CWNU-1]
MRDREPAAEAAAGGFVQTGAWISVPRAVSAEADALILVDAQAAFLTGAQAVPGAERLTERLAALLRRARAAGALVVHLRNDGEPGAVDEPGTPGWQLLLAVSESADEHIVAKDGDDGFHGTKLGPLLDQRGARRVVIAGVLSEMCVSATARGALAHDLEVVLPHDTHATYGLDDIPAPVVSRVAEHALGSDPVFVQKSDAVRFAPPTRFR